MIGEWLKRDVLEAGQLNFINYQLVDCQKIDFPPLHIKLKLMKQFVKVLNKENDCYKYLRESFPGLSQEKLKIDIFDGPQVGKMNNGKQYSESITFFGENCIGACLARLGMFSL